MIEKTSEWAALAGRRLAECNALQARVAELGLALKSECTQSVLRDSSCSSRIRGLESRNAGLVAAIRDVADYIEREIVMTAAMERKMIKPLRDAIADNGSAKEASS